jgi:hypothetical protein
MKFLKYLEEQMSSAPENWFISVGRYKDLPTVPINPSTEHVLRFARENVKHWDDAKHTILVRILQTKNLPELLAFLPVDARKIQEQIDSMIAERYSVMSKADLMNAVKAAYIEQGLRQKSLATYTDKDIRWNMAMELFTSGITKSNDY